jgi:hypothetical protein
MMGKKFGRLTVIGRAENAKNRQAEWFCDCDCGTKNVKKNGNRLRSGHTTSCGCVHSEVCAKMLTKHGYAAGELSRAYETWQNIKDRCFNPNNKAYSRYGGIGIVICKGWRESYPNFLASMGERPSDEHSIDRIDNSGNYSCGQCGQCVENGWVANCRWATRLEQGRNKRNNIFLTVNNVSRCLAEWARETGINPGTLQRRVAAGWSHEDAVLTPVRPTGRLPNTTSSQSDPAPSSTIPAYPA